MISVKEAQSIILSHLQDFGVEKVSLQNAVGRVLKEPILGDRDFPPFNRVTMDGIAIQYSQFEKGIRTFYIEGLAAAGAPEMKLDNSANCLEVMTGAMLPQNTDTVIRYEDVVIKEGGATIQVDVLKYEQNVHFQGLDQNKGDLLIEEGIMLSPAEIGVCATVGKKELLVAKHPNILIISSGDELVEVDENPLPHQIRKSNVWQLKAILKKNGFEADTAHLRDKKQEIVSALKSYLNNYDVLLFSGAVSKGKFDFLPEALEEVGVQKHFHRVKQRPGKPFWFGTTDQGKTVFAFPGNPVSTFACAHFYLLDWLQKSLAQQKVSKPYAILNEDFTFKPDLTFFLQVKISFDNTGKLLATPVAGNGSGDLANLAYGDGFLVIPQGKNEFKNGEVYPVILYR